MKLKLAVKEWAGVVDALCDGSQIMFVRKYEPDQKHFLLYPTYSYFLNDQKQMDRFNSKFQQKYRLLAKQAAEKELENRDLVQIKAMFEVDEVNQFSAKDVPKLEPFMIWSVGHVQSYAEKAKDGLLFVWIGRTKILSKPVVAARQTTGGSITLYRHFEDVDVVDAKSALSDEEYLRKKQSLRHALKL